MILSIDARLYRLEFTADRGLEGDTLPIAPGGWIC